MQPPARMSSFMELSNAAAKFRKHLIESQINWATEAGLAGPAIVNLVTAWHVEEGEKLGLDLAASKYSVLAHNSQWSLFQILAFALNLRVANPIGEVEWLMEGASLNGYMDDDGRRHRLWQCFMNSGGQLKYFPLLRWADWMTDTFALEVPPVRSPVARAQVYFSETWPSAWGE